MGSGSRDQTNGRDSRRLSYSRLIGTSSLWGPRAVLAEFGTIIPEDVEIRVSESMAMVRYLVLARR